MRVGVEEDLPWEAGEVDHPWGVAEGLVAGEGVGVHQKVEVVAEALEKTLEAVGEGPGTSVGVSGEELTLKVGVAAGLPLSDLVLSMGVGVVGLPYGRVAREGLVMGQGHDLGVGQEGEEQRL